MGEWIWRTMNCSRGGKTVPSSTEWIMNYWSLRKLLVKQKILQYLFAIFRTVLVDIIFEKIHYQLLKFRMQCSLYAATGNFVAVNKLHYDSILWAFKLNSSPDDKFSFWQMWVLFESNMPSLRWNLSLFSNTIDLSAKYEIAHPQRLWIYNNLFRANDKHPRNKNVSALRRELGPFLLNNEMYCVHFSATASAPLRNHLLLFAPLPRKYDVHLGV